MQIRMYRKSAASVESGRRTGHIFEGCSLPSLRPHVCLSLLPCLSPLPLYVSSFRQSAPFGFAFFGPLFFPFVSLPLLLSSGLVCATLASLSLSAWLRFCVALSSCSLLCPSRHLNLHLQLLVDRCLLPSWRRNPLVGERCVVWGRLWGRALVAEPLEESHCRNPAPGLTPFRP